MIRPRRAMPELFWFVSGAAARRWRGPRGARPKAARAWAQGRAGLGTRPRGPGHKAARGWTQGRTGPSTGPYRAKHPTPPGQAPGRTGPSTGPRRAEAPDHRDLRNARKSDNVKYPVRRSPWPHSNVRVRRLNRVLACRRGDKATGGTRRSVRWPPGRPQARHVTGTRNQPSSAAQAQATRNRQRRTKERTVPVAQVVSMKQLLESGVHFGHQTRRWNPKMKRYIFTERNGIYIIDLQQSLDYIDRAYEFIKETVAHGGTILYVGTKKQAQEAIAEQARRVGMPFVNQRWLGGMLTNFSTVYKRLQRLKELEEIDFGDVAGSGMTKKELLQL